jgi:hypothetical protein
MQCEEMFDVLCKKQQQSINTIRGPAEDLVLMYPTWCVLGEIMSYDDHLFVTPGGSIIVGTKLSSRHARLQTQAGVSAENDKW